ncbi:MAG: sodium:alanine symporter [Porticoccaceae bacterium]|nr:MAG: sodium:alanine symporter [Porticoccaceae bacterium]
MAESWVTALQTLNGWVWGVPTMALILGTGLYLTVGLRLLPLRRLGYGFAQLWRGRRALGEGEISPFAALMTALSATVGTGNIVGVATAVTIGGPGALFWMWCTALVGMATKYAEAVLAVRYREVDKAGQRVGGPMYYIRNGLGRRFAWLAFAFALFGTLAGFGIGNSVQANSVADALHGAFGVPEGLTGGVLAVLVGLVLIGGIRRIARAAEALVPAMGALYLVACAAVLADHWREIPGALALIVVGAFEPLAAQGGFAGATLAMTIQMGVARGIFSNEAGLGSAPIAHAAAATDSPVRQGTVAMLGTFIDTLVICTLTGFALIASGAWRLGREGAAVTAAAFAGSLPQGDAVVAVCLALFAFTTILGWSYYGERCAEYLFGLRAVPIFRVLWVAAAAVGAKLELDLAWLVADTLNALMAIPNLVALILLSPVVFALTREYFAGGGK